MSAGCSTWELGKNNLINFVVRASRPLPSLVRLSHPLPSSCGRDTRTTTEEFANLLLPES